MRYVVILFIVKDILDFYKFNILKRWLSESDLEIESLGNEEFRNNLLWYFWMVIIRFNCM